MEDPVYGSPLLFMNRNWLPIFISTLVLGGSVFVLMDATQETEASDRPSSAQVDVRRSAVEPANRVQPRKSVSTTPTWFSASKGEENSTALKALKALKVKVVMGASGKVVDGASVILLGNPVLPNLQYTDKTFPWHDPATWDLPTTQFHRTNQQGLISIQPFASTISLVARKGDLMGTTLPWSHGQTEDTVRIIELWPIQIVKVKLTTASGKPAVGDWIQVYSPSLRGGVHGSGRTNELGVASIHVPLCGFQRSQDPVTVLVPLGVFEKKPIVVFQIFDLPDEPIPIQLPPTGKVEISVFDSKGLPFLGEVDVQLDLVHGNPTYAYSSAKKTTGNGKVLFQRIGLGQALQVRAWAEDAESLNQVTFPGPYSDGDIVRANIHLAKTVPTLTAVLMDEHFRPLPNFLIKASFGSTFANRKTPFDKTLSTDLYGRFSIKMPPYACTFVCTPYKKQSKLGAIRIPLDRGPAAGLHDFGSLRFPQDD